MQPNFLFKTRGGTRVFSPPLDFIKVEDPHDVRVIKYAHPTRRLSASRRAGLRYEKRWTQFISTLWGGQYYTFNDKLLAFSDRKGQRCCKPDGVLVPRNADWFAIFEVKVGHISDSFWQLRHLYEPVLSQWAPLKNRRPLALEVCRRYDPATFYPCSTKVLNVFDLDEYLAAPQNPEEIGVVVWKDR